MSHKTTGSLSLCGHCSIDAGYDLDRACHRFYTAAPNLFSQGSRSCTDLGDTCQTLPRGLPTSTTFLHRKLGAPIMTISRLHVPGVLILPRATNPDSARCMIEAIWTPVIRLISLSPILLTTATNAKSTSILI
jgi:hypothetical protein